MSAQQTPALTVQPVMHIHRIATLQALIDLSAFNPGVAFGIKALTIILPAGSGDAVQAVRHALRLAPNLERLVLNLAFATPDYLLAGITFHALKFLSTNLSHTTLSSFLHRHPLIITLVLRGRECTTCPIRGVEFPNLMALQCSSNCLQTGIAHGRLVHPSDRLALVPISNVLTPRLPALCLENLSLDFYPDEHDILADVAAAVPNVRRLKLNEKPHPRGRTQPSRRAWRNLTQWHRALLRMPLLEEFALCTLVQIGLGTRSESAVVAGWANGCGRRALPHPNLFRVGLIQQHAQIGQRLSHWFKRGCGEWECISTSMVGPHHNFCV